MPPSIDRPSSAASSSSAHPSLHRKASSANVKVASSQHQQRPSSASSQQSGSYEQLPQMQAPQQQQQQHAHGSVARMEELYEVGEVIGTGTFGIIRKVSSLCFRCSVITTELRRDTTYALHRSSGGQMDWCVLPPYVQCVDSC